MKVIEANWFLKITPILFIDCALELIVVEKRNPTLDITDI